MNLLIDKFSKLGCDNAPGQEGRQHVSEIQFRGEKIPGIPVDFSHGDVNTNAFEPTPGALEEFIAGVKRGGEVAYTEYRGSSSTREDLAGKLAKFTGAIVSADNGLIITPGSQGALFLAMGATIGRGDKVAIVQPDYFANRKLVEFFDGELIPVRMDYLGSTKDTGLDLTQLEDAFKAGARLFLFSNPNNPAGVIYSATEIRAIADLAQKYGATVIVDQLYSRLLYDGRTYTHLRAMDINPDNVITIMGPSKTESLSGYRLGVAFGSSTIIDRMEKLQAIVSLRAPGYSQAVLKTWFSEPTGWMDERITLHQAIRDDLLMKFRPVEGVKVRTTEAGSYIFPRIPELAVTTQEFIKILRLQAGVTVTPGTEFAPYLTDSFRLNFSQNHEAAIHAIERIVELIERYRK
ncbi:MAG: aspB [Anaerosporomusa subterranea]|jgi:aspartate/methionine/tyrosine aminotransferase|nr:aspB [Anaerosporomusa subterranea]